MPSGDDVSDLPAPGEELPDDQTRFTFKGGEGAEVRVQRFISGATLTERDRMTCTYKGPPVVLLLDRSPDAS